MEKITLQFSKLECYQDYLRNPNNLNKKGVYILGFSFVDMKPFKVHEFRPYYVGKHESDIHQRIQKHVYDRRYGTSKIIHKDVLSVTNDYKTVCSKKQNSDVVYDNALLRKAKSDLSSDERVKLIPHVDAYVDNLYVTYIETNNIIDKNDEQDFIAKLENYIQKRMGNKSMASASKSSKCDEEFESKFELLTNIGTENIFD